MRKWKKAAVAAMVCLTGVLFMPSMKAEAKNPSMVELKAGKTYKSYDITGDKKKDTVKISIPKDQYDRYGTVKITVNKKTTKIIRTWTSFFILINTFPRIVFIIRLTLYPEIRFSVL